MFSPAFPHMKATVTKHPMTCLLLAVCLGAAPAALAQTHFSSPSSGKKSSRASAHASPSRAPENPYFFIIPPTPEKVAAGKQAYALLVEAAADQHAGRYAQAEAEARAGMAIDPMGANDVALAQALEAQGKTQEALQIYQSKLVIQDQHGLHQTGDGLFLPYAWLLLNSGQWKQAVAAYNAALPFTGDVGPHPELPIIHDSDVIRANSNFSPNVPEPERLALMIHLARGIQFNGKEDGAHEPQNTEAFAEYDKALQLAPNSTLANYFYGIGWNKLSYAEQQQFGSEQQVKAQKALIVAIKIGLSLLLASAILISGNVRQQRNEILKSLSVKRKS